MAIRCTSATPAYHHALPPHAPAVSINKQPLPPVPSSVGHQPTSLPYMPRHKRCLSPCNHSPTFTHTLNTLPLSLSCTYYPPTRPGSHPPSHSNTTMAIIHSPSKPSHSRHLSTFDPASHALTQHLTLALAQLPILLPSQLLSQAHTLHLTLVNPTHPQAHHPAEAVAH